jgi:hypothetical protein
MSLAHFSRKFCCVDIQILHLCTGRSSRKGGVHCCYARRMLLKPACSAGKWVQVEDTTDWKLPHKKDKLRVILDYTVLPGRELSSQRENGHGMEITGLSFHLDLQLFPPLSNLKISISFFTNCVVTYVLHIFLTPHYNIYLTYNVTKQGKRIVLDRPFPAFNFLFPAGMTLFLCSCHGDV